MWDRETTAESFRLSAIERIKQRPAREEWAKFCSLYSDEFFAAFDDAGDAKQPQQTDHRQQLTELPTAQAWERFESAIGALQNDGDRQAAAKGFREVATKYAGTYYAQDSQELADLLDNMLEEDHLWQEPKEVAALSQAEQIAYHVYHLRDVVAHQWSQPGYCHVLSSGLLDEGKPNSVQALLEMKEAAIPALLALLDDRRPIRAVGYWRNFYPTRTVLRYHDAAIQILNELLPDKPYVRRTTSSYLSAEDEEDRAKIIQRVRESWQRDKGEAALDRR